MSLTGFLMKAKIPITVKTVGTAIAPIKARKNSNLSVPLDTASTKSPANKGSIPA